MPYQARNCQVCQATFTPPHRANALSSPTQPGSWGTYSASNSHLFLCAKCRRAVKAVEAAESQPPDTPVEHKLAAPLTQVVFDLETWGLDRGWGVTLVASFLIHGAAKGPVMRTLALRDYAPWKAGKRSDDSQLVKDIFSILKTGQVAYAHNGDYFDIRWLRSAALKYRLEMPKLKLIDPAQISRKKYLVGRNSLEAMADFIGVDKLGLAKMHIKPDTWRGALLDNDDTCWLELIQRCESDVLLLNSVASAVTGDVGMIDYTGSAYK